MKPRQDFFLHIVALFIGPLLILLLPICVKLLSYQPDPMLEYDPSATVVPVINWIVIAIWIRPQILFGVAVLSFLGVLLVLQIFPPKGKLTAWVLASICGLIALCYSAFYTLDGSIHTVKYLHGVSIEGQRYHLFAVKYPSGPLENALYRCNPIGLRCVGVELPMEMQIHSIADITEIEPYIRSLHVSP